MSEDVSRRFFMKLVAATGAGVAVPGCQPEVRKLIPYVIPDENATPGVPAFYATRCGECPSGCGVVARVREGRAIKLEGNPKDPISEGGICARGQAALQGLYNPDRLQAPMLRGATGQLAPISWQHALDLLSTKLRAASAAGEDRVLLLTEPFGPTLSKVAASWSAAWKSKRTLRYRPIDEYAARESALRCFGRADLPIHRLDGADVIVSLGADFLDTSHSPVEMARQYAAFRQPRGQRGSTVMGHSFYFGPRFSLTAANCDEWLAVDPGAEALVGLAILNVLSNQTSPRLVNLAGIDLKRWTAGFDPESVASRVGIEPARLERVATEFARADSPLAIAGTDNELTHSVAFALNARSGAMGRTVFFAAGQADDPPSPQAEIRETAESMRAGKVDVALIANANPAFALPSDTKFNEAISKVPFVAWCGTVPDETAQSAHILLPTHPWLESWGDAIPRGYVAGLSQPVMQPVFDSHPLGDILLTTLRASTAPADGHPHNADTRTAVEATWRELHSQLGESAGFDQFWETARQSGGSYRAPGIQVVTLRPEPFAQPPQVEPPQQSTTTVVAFPHIFLYDGRGADKPWLQEIPEPVSQIVWDSWAEIHPETARGLGIDANQIVEVSTQLGTVSVPARITDHIKSGVVAIPIGQGHSAYGRYAKGRGANPWTLLPMAKMAAKGQVRPTAARRKLVSPSGVEDMLNRPIVEVISLRQLRERKKPESEEPEPPEPYEFYDKYTYPEHHWGMTIDLNSCSGCSACVAACYAENNLPFVGKEEVARGRIMSWIRIERFVPTKRDAPPLYVIPMLCQQCDHAPCEPVCPVFASYHTDEGINGQVYNRCIGTRYCENNCPYKVRRFNFYAPKWPEPLHLQLNPDVTGRGAGVMEKCTFCIQRIRAVEMDAEEQGRPVADGEIVPACAQACPSRAITFGDIKDVRSAMMSRRDQNELRAYRALEELNTQPAIMYLRKVYRSPEES